MYTHMHRVLAPMDLSVRSEKRDKNVGMLDREGIAVVKRIIPN
jgi:hypothetical protein